ncbi:DUF6074 family protein [Mesorhizobium sp. ISC25]|uniref:DUF6074 family protein n=1 Tax=Mesorhizobium sp. ISC25 TaxID=3077335 RepID=UPI0035DCD235
MSRQLSLFDVPIPIALNRSAEVVLHPAWCRSLVSQAAREILTRPVTKQGWHRRDQMAIFRARVAARGLGAAAIEREMKTFDSTLQCELRRQVIMSILRDQGDAA